MMSLCILNSSCVMDIQVCIDNSEWTRSGDYAPTRFQAQADAVNLLAGAKTQAHPENTVGVLTMGGKTPRVLVTPTPDLGKVCALVMPDQRCSIRCRRVQQQHQFHQQTSQMPASVGTLICCQCSFMGCRCQSRR